MRLSPDDFMDALLSLNVQAKPRVEQNVQGQLPLQRVFLAWHYRREIIFVND